MTNKIAFAGTFDRTLWLNPDDVEVVKALTTRGKDDREPEACLLVTMRQSGNTYWLLDSPSARETLKLEVVDG